MNNSEIALMQWFKRNSGIVLAVVEILALGGDHKAKFIRTEK